VTLIYGHRGAKGEAPENTLTSFQECLKHGVRRCELDLHLSMDGELMVIHDPTLKRTTDRRGKVVEHGRRPGDLRRAKAARAGSSPARSRLEELFEKCDFEHWQLEVKSASRTRAATTVLAIREMAQRMACWTRSPSPPARGKCWRRWNWCRTCHAAWSPNTPGSTR
jgi:glycerophosphoryl diester phosphodiesterase